MAVDAYIQTAAHQLRDAAVALQGEIHDIQAGAYDHEVNLKNEISHTEYDVTALKTELNARESMGNDDRKREINDRVRVLETEIGQKKQAVNKQSADAANIVRGKQALLQQLQNLASQLEGLASSAR